MTESNKPNEIACPTCEKASVFSPINPHRPFCSERCKLIDLGAWAAEDYKIPTKEALPAWEEADKI